MKEKQQELVAVETEVKETDLPALTPADTNYLIDAKAFEHGQRVAKMFAACDFVPTVFKGKVADCFIAMHMAWRLKADPIFLMQHMSVINGKPGLDGQFIISQVNTSGRYPDGIEFEYSGQGDSRACRAFGVRVSGKTEEASCSVQMAKDAGWWSRNPNWKALTDQMLAYRSATFLARKYCPQVIGGMACAEEVRDVDGVTVVGSARVQSDKARELTQKLEGKKG